MVTAPPEQMAPGAGRPRPPHVPKKVDCPNCGSRLEIRDEASRLVVCVSCGSYVELSAAERKVVAEGGDAAEADTWHFDFEVGDSYRHRMDDGKIYRFEVAARMAYIEDGSRAWTTRMYLLYHPGRGSLWLSEYDGLWDVSRSTHVMPKRDVWGLSKAAPVETHDGRSWHFVESGTYELAYVDGALPWVAEVGDTVRYAELLAADGSGETFEVEAAAREGGDQELEFGHGRRLDVEEVRRGAKNPEIRDPVGRREDLGEVKRGYAKMARWAAILLGLNVLLLLYALLAGDKVLEQRFAASDLTPEVLTEPFEVADDGNALEIRLDVPGLSNAWMYVNVALLRGGDVRGGDPFAGGAVVHVDDADIEYYHGSSGGESWSEGSRDQSVWVRAPEAGTYRLVLRAVSNYGNAPSAQASQHPLAVEVIDGARRRLFPIFGVVLCLAGLAWVGFSYASWKSPSD